MSLVSIGRLGRDLMRNKALRKSFQEDPEEALTRYPHPFNPQERAALLAGDVGTLYRMGANAFLMGYFARYRIFGLDPASYSERMRAVDDRQRDS
ncbi:MAG: hypothetical protein WAN75_26900 [Xanthobacteraceae bacterium]|jgi:hypothetical protein